MLSLGQPVFSYEWSWNALCRKLPLWAVFGQQLTELFSDTVLQNLIWFSTINDLVISHIISNHTMSGIFSVVCNYTRQLKLNKTDLQSG